MRFWSVTVLVATLLLLLYVATYFSVSRTTERTTGAAIEPSPGEEHSAGTRRGEILDVGPAKLEFFLNRAEGPVLVDFWAARCASCKSLAPTLKTLAVEFTNRATVLRVDFDEHFGLAQRFDVTAVPTLIIFTDGREVERFEGVTSESVLRESLRRAGANESLADVAPHQTPIASASSE